MSFKKHFQKQIDATKERGDPALTHFWVMSDKSGKLEVYSIKIGEVDKFLKNHRLVHCDHLIPRFEVIKKDD